MEEPKPFFISIHDVAPETMGPTRTILSKLEPLVGPQVSMAVIPAPWLELAIHQKTEFVDEIERRAGEVLIHGLQHRRNPSWHPFSMMVNHSDEFRAMDAREATKRIDTGREILSDLFRFPIRGFAPPAWCAGPVKDDFLKDADIDFVTELYALKTKTGACFPLATWSWDCGRFWPMGYLGEAIGHTGVLRRNCYPNIVFHPADVERGFVSWGVKRIEKLLDRGYQPQIYGAMLAAKSNPEESLQNKLGGAA